MNANSARGASTRKVLYIGLTGASCSGKSTIADKLCKTLVQDRFQAIHIEQDDYFIPENELEWIEELHFRNWDPEDGAIDFDRMIEAMDQRIEDELKNSSAATVEPVVVVIEGHVILTNEMIRDRLDLIYFLSLDHSVCEERRVRRVFPPNPPGYVDPVGYFDKYYWPSYENYKKLVENLELDHCPFMDVSDQLSYAKAEAKILKESRQLVCTDWISIVDDDLCIKSAVDFVTDPKCGAVATFCGTTRDNFDGKAVKKLEYEAYKPMAMAKMKIICNDVKNKWPTVHRIAMLHRIGEVPPPETSVIIAISSPHRSDALQSVQFAIDQLKMTVPIWKKEEYIDGTSDWKENCNCTGSEKL